MLETAWAARAEAAAPQTELLVGLQTRIAADRAANTAAPALGAAVQRALELALAAAPALQAIDLVSPEGVVRWSTEPTAIGRPADEGATRPAAQLALADATGAPLGSLVAHARAEPRHRPQAPLALVLASSLPLLLWLAVLLAPRQGDAGDGDERAALQRLQATRERLARAAQEVVWLEAAGADQESTGVWTRTGGAGR